MMIFGERVEGKMEDMKYTSENWDWEGKKRKTKQKRIIKVLDA